MAMPKIPSIKMPAVSFQQMQSKVPNVTLNPESFNDLINSQGIRMIHQKPVPCPNIRDINAPAHESNCSYCYNGFVYYDQREFIGALGSNSMDRVFGANGTWDMDQATIIVPSKDMQGNVLDVQYFDQILLPDYTVRYYQRLEHSQGGIDRLHFPASSVDFVMDRTGKVYRIGVDVVTEEGRLRWIGDRPPYDAMIRKGTIVSVNYYTKPSFTVVGMPHQLRAAQTKDPLGGSNIQARFPQLVVVKKDFIPHDAADTVGAPDRPEPKRGSVL